MILLLPTEYGYWWILKDKLQLSLVVCQVMIPLGSNGQFKTYGHTDDSVYTQRLQITTKWMDVEMNCRGKWELIRMDGEEKRVQ